MANTFY